MTHIVPILAERSEKKSLNMERLASIVTEASEQSGRGTVPQIEPICTLGDCIQLMQKRGVVTCAFDIEAPLFSRSCIDSTVSLGLFIGPEGGWSPHEVELFHRTSVPVYSLGTQVLRAETAAVATLSVSLLSV